MSKFRSLAKCLSYTVASYSAKVGQLLSGSLLSTGRSTSDSFLKLLELWSRAGAGAGARVRGIVEAQIAMDTEPRWGVGIDGVKRTPINVREERTG